MSTAAIGSIWNAIFIVVPPDCACALHGKAGGGVQWADGVYLRTSRAAVRSAWENGVFEDLDLAGLVHEGGVKADICEGATRRSAAKLFGGGAEAGNLARAQAFGGAGVGGAGFDLNADDLRTAFKDEVDLASLSAPACMQETCALPLVEARDLLFGGVAAQVGGFPAGAAGRLRSEIERH